MALVHKALKENNGLCFSWLYLCSSALSALTPRSVLPRGVLRVGLSGFGAVFGGSSLCLESQEQNRVRGTSVIHKISRAALHTLPTNEEVRGSSDKRLPVGGSQGGLRGTHRFQWQRQSRHKENHFCPKNNITRSPFKPGAASTLEQKVALISLFLWAFLWSIRILSERALGTGSGVRKRGTKKHKQLTDVWCSTQSARHM